jgi:hypothetical protein
VQDSAASEGPQQVGTLEAIKVKILVLGEDSSIQSIRIELTCETDLFFHFSSTLDEAGFQVCATYFSCRSLHRCLTYRISREILHLAFTGSARKAEINGRLSRLP